MIKYLQNLVIQLKGNMRFLLILMFCSSCLLVNCAALKCYKSSNIDIFKSNSTIEECWSYNNEFCATATIRNGQVSYLSCGDEELCIRKSCTDSIYCTKPGTYERDYPRLNNMKYTVTCCDTDLCNV